MPDKLKKELSADLLLQEQLYTKLLELAQKKRSLFLDSPVGIEQVTLLEQIIKDEDVLLAEVSALEDAFAALDENLLKNELSDYYSRLQVTITELKRVNLENAHLLKNLQNYVNFSLNLLEKVSGNGIYQVGPGGNKIVKKVAAPQSRFVKQV